MRYLYINEETDAVSIYECLIKGITFSSFETKIYIDWCQGYGSFVIKCLYPTMIEYNFSSISEEDSNCRNMVINHLEITGFSYLKDDNGYFIQFNFDNYPIGYIRMHCTQFVFDAPSLPTVAGQNDHRIPWDSTKIEDPLSY